MRNSLIVSCGLILLEGIVFFDIRNGVWLFIEAAAAFLLFRKRLRFLFIYLLSRCFLLLFVKALLTGVFISGIYYIPFDNIFWILIFLFLVCLDILMIVEKRTKLYRKELQYPIMIRIENQSLKLTGYLDTGNKSTKLHIPIIVLNERFLIYFEKKDSVELLIGSVNLISKQRAYLCELSVENGVYQQVWAIFSDQLSDIECLLNIHNI